MHLLDNIFWHALYGAQAHLAVGDGAVRRYAPGYCALAGFAEVRAPDFAALAALCEPGEPICCDGWDGAVPPGWRLERDAHAYRMVWAAPIPANDPALDAVRLGREHAAAARALAASTPTCLFGERSLELGDYFGYVENTQLVAMAGERLCVDGLREIGNICVHPACDGRGLARRLVAKLARRQLMRGETPFLHVLQSDHAARTLYRQMGFRDHCLSPVRIISRLPPNATGAALAHAI
jgi:GNAT superfamily N-acetyltransferase